MNPQFSGSTTRFTAPGELEMHITSAIDIAFMLMCCAINYDVIY